VEAPLGVIARPMPPDSKKTSASTVGLPRESSTCLARTSSIWVMIFSSLLRGCLQGLAARAKTAVLWMTGQRRQANVFLHLRQFLEKLSLPKARQGGKTVRPASLFCRS
jgi:hypothetical protein